MRSVYIHSAQRRLDQAARARRAIKAAIAKPDPEKANTGRQPLAESEIEIGRRLRQWRKQTMIQRTKMAQAIGIGSERLASYEAGRAPLPFQIFVALASRFGVSADWLGSGLAPMEKPNDWPAMPQESGRFSDVYAAIQNGKARS